MILAAGFGTRLRPYTHSTPKPLFTIAERPILDLAIRRLEASGCSAVIVNTHHLHDRINAFLNSQQYDIPVYTSFEPILLGTGGAIKNVAPIIPRFKKTGAAAGAAKCLRLLSTPIKKATRLTRII